MFFIHLRPSMADYSRNKRDRNRWFIAGILFFISIWMLMVPVMPHHHHSNGMMCMKNDVTADCCTPTNEDGYDRTQQTDHQQRLQTTSGNHHHCCCNTDCVTLHFLQNMPHSTDFSLQADYSWIATLYTYESVLRLLLLPDEASDRQSPGYLESLHGIFITEAQGLRAPPSFITA